MELRWSDPGRTWLPATYLPRYIPTYLRKVATGYLVYRVDVPRIGTGRADETARLGKVALVHQMARVSRFLRCLDSLSRQSLVNCPSLCWLAGSSRAPFHRPRPTLTPLLRWQHMRTQAIARHTDYTRPYRIYSRIYRRSWRIPCPSFPPAHPSLAVSTILVAGTLRGGLGRGRGGRNWGIYFLGPLSCANGARVYRLIPQTSNYSFCLLCQKKSAMLPIGCTFLRCLHFVCSLVV